MSQTSLLEPIDAVPERRPIDGWCHALKTDGTPCKQRAAKGCTVCRFHGANAPQVRRAAARRLAEAEAAKTLADVEVTPIGNPLEALAEVAEEARAWMRHAGNLTAELDAMTLTTDSGAEQVRAIVALYERATDRVAKLLADWVRLGFDERMVHLAERQAELVEAYVLALVGDLELTDEQAARVPDAAVRHLGLLTGAIDTTEAAA